MTHDWRGSLIILSKQGTDFDPPFYQDVTAADLRVAVDYFIAYGDETIDTTTSSSVLTGWKVEGVKINCQGDQDTFGVEKYTTVDVPTDRGFCSCERAPDFKAARAGHFRKEMTS
jgi:hypothetical protein